MNTREKAYSLFLLAILFILGLVFTLGTSPAATIIVDAKSNIFGGGHAIPLAPGGLGPGILLPVYSLSVGPNQAVTFYSVTGSISCNGGGSYWGPEGYDLADRSKFSFIWWGFWNSHQFISVFNRCFFGRHRTV